MLPKSDQPLEPTFIRMKGCLESRMGSRVFRTTDPSARRKGR
jgi:hypothetical protein